MTQRTFVVGNAWAINPLVTQEDVYICAQHALQGAQSTDLHVLQQAIPHGPSVVQAPVATGENYSVAWATWHHGSDFYTYWCGDVESILHRAELTDTERETVLLRARRFATQGLLVYATGATQTHSIPKHLVSGIEHIGLVTIHPSV